MRPTARRQSALRAPLNDVLRTEANTRLLRALTLHAAPLTPSELAQHTQLQLSGIPRTLRSLEETGIIEFVGAGGRRSVQIRDRHPLAQPLRALFTAERDRANTVIDTLRTMAQRVYPVPIAAWIEGPVATGLDRPEDAIIVVILTETTNVEAVREAMETSIGTVELDADVELRIRTRADLLVATPEERRQLAATIPLLGSPPSSSESKPVARRSARGKMPTHAQADARSRALAAAIAERLTTDPTLLQRARAWIDDRLQRSTGPERHALREWARILRTTSLPRLRRFLVDPGERATRLRQSSPFVAVLTPDERRELVDSHALNAK
jgi:DNA-binding transcriptional ArsR family regulator